MPTVKSPARSTKPTNSTKPASVSGTRKPKAERPSKTIPPATAQPHVLPDEMILADLIQIKHNDRTEFDDAKIETLAAAIAARGLDNSITVRKTGEASYELIAGERRLRAMRSLEWLHVRCRVITATDQEADLLRLEENILREDLSAIDKAAGIKRYIELHGENQTVVGKRFGMTQAQVSNLLRLLQLPAVWQDWVKTGEIPHTVVRDVLCPWSHRPQLLEWVAAEIEKNYGPEEVCHRDELETLIIQGTRLLTRSCRKVQLFDWTTSIHANECCFKLDDKNRHALDIEKTETGEERAWNIDAWEQLNAPALKSAQDKLKKRKAEKKAASPANPGKSKSKTSESVCDSYKLKSALQIQLRHKLADAIHPKKHAKVMARMFFVLAMADDVGDAVFGETRYSGIDSEQKNAQTFADIPEAEFPGKLVEWTQATLREEHCYLQCQTIMILASMLPIDLMHDWLPNWEILNCYSDGQLVAFAHDHEQDHDQPRQSIIECLLNKGVWQPGYVPQEVLGLLV